VFERERKLTTFKKKDKYNEKIHYFEFENLKIIFMKKRNWPLEDPQHLEILFPNFDFNS